ncbi:MAG: PQQ-dependent sugar dehydrogenase, partial [Candidatus Krumholzibacteriia bacterium]
MRGHHVPVATGRCRDPALQASTRAQTLADGLLEVTTWACCPQFPTSFAFLPSGPLEPLDVLICEKFTGRVQRYRDGVFQDTVLDLAVSAFAERGLLGIELHPDFDSNGFVYLFYTASPTDQDVLGPSPVLENRVARFTWDGSALGSELVMLTLPARPSFAHNGGVLRFGPDGMLYGVIGNLGRYGQLQNIASGDPPDTTSIIFRIQDDGTPPADNPFFGAGGAMQLVYGYGVRNSYGLEFDPVSGVLWQTENGPSEYDEINRFLPGFNSGFTRILGPESRSPATVDDLWQAPGSHYSDPRFSWLDNVAPAPIHFLRSDSLGTRYRNDCFVGAYNTQSIYHFELTADRSMLVMPDSSVEDLVADSDTERDLFLWASGFGGGVVWLDTGPDGALYALTFDNGRLFRIARAQVSDAGPREAEDFVRPRLEAWPNPFHAETWIHLRGHGNDAGQLLRIYTVSGRVVRTLEGRGVLAWDCTDSRGRPVAPGIPAPWRRNSCGSGEPHLEVDCPDADPHRDVDRLPLRLRGARLRDSLGAPALRHHRGHRVRFEPGRRCVLPGARGRRGLPRSAGFAAALAVATVRAARARHPGRHPAGRLRRTALGRPRQLLRRDAPEPRGKPARQDRPRHRLRGAGIVSDGWNAAGDGAGGR